MRALPEIGHREWRARASLRYGTALSEGLLMAGRDGVTFKRWNEAFLRPGIEREGTWNYGHQYIAWHLVETKSGLEGAPNELSLYATESYWTGASSVLRRYSLRLDGFVSVNAPLSGGEVVTKPLLFAGGKLGLNFSTSAAGSVQVEILDDFGRPLPGFALADCPPVFGDAIERPVTWRKSGDVSRLAGRPVRLRFVLRDADLFAFRFSDPLQAGGVHNPRAQLFGLSLPWQTSTVPDLTWTSTASWRVFSLGAMMNVRSGPLLRTCSFSTVTSSWPGSLQTL